jgi:hypothetical protein
MKRTLVTICLLACIAIALPLVAQQKSAAPAADPITGSWTGDWGPSAQDRNAVTVDLKYDGKAITGVVKTANRPEVALSKGSYDAATKTVKLEAMAKNPRSGADVHYVIEGKLAGNAMSGDWNHDATKGDFKLTKK